MWRFGERDVEDAPPPLNIDYLKGLNFLLNEQTDQALEHFLEMVRVDDKTIETHFALGSLFRRRGEVDRAIRIHQNIIARPDLAAEQRDQALFSLAKDYNHAGLLDRAENLFARLSEGSRYQVQALESLCRIYEQEKEWERAIEAAEKLEILGAAHWRYRSLTTTANLRRIRPPPTTMRRHVPTSRRRRRADRGRCAAR